MDDIVGLSVISGVVAFSVGVVGASLYYFFCWAGNKKDSPIKEEASVQGATDSSQAGDGKHALYKGKEEINPRPMGEEKAIELTDVDIKNMTPEQFGEGCIGGVEKGGSVPTLSINSPYTCEDLVGSSVINPVTEVKMTLSEYLNHACIEAIGEGWGYCAEEVLPMLHWLLLHPDIIVISGVCPFLCDMLTHAKDYPKYLYLTIQPANPTIDVNLGPKFKGWVAKMLTGSPTSDTFAKLASLPMRTQADIMKLKNKPRGTDGWPERVLSDLKLEKAEYDALYNVPKLPKILEVSESLEPVSIYQEPIKLGGGCISKLKPVTDKPEEATKGYKGVVPAVSLTTPSGKPFNFSWPSSVSEVCGGVSVVDKSISHASGLVEVDSNPLDYVRHPGAWKETSVAELEQIDAKLRLFEELPPNPNDKTPMVVGNIVWFHGYMPGLPINKPMPESIIEFDGAVEVSPNMQGAPMAQTSIDSSANFVSVSRDSSTLDMGESLSSASKGSIGELVEEDDLFWTTGDHPFCASVSKPKTPLLLGFMVWWGFSFLLFVY